MSETRVRSLGCYDFEGGGQVSIRVIGDVTTEDALAMAEQLIALKREEIESRKETPR